MECPRCKATIYKDTRFCLSCGLNVEELVKELEEEAQTDAETESENEGEESVDKASEESEGKDASSEDESDDRGESSDSADGDEQKTDSEQEPDLTDKPEPEDAAGQGDDDSCDDGDSESDEHDADGHTVGSVAEASTSTQDKPPASKDDEQAEQGTQPAEGKRRLSWAAAKSFVLRHKKVSIAVAVLVVIVLVVCVARIVGDIQESRRAEEAKAAYEQVLSTPVPVAVTLDIDNYNEEHMTPIPLRVRGTSTSGEEVDSVSLVTPNESQLLLLPGTYGISLEGRPASDEGVLYDGSVDTFTVVVPANVPSETDENSLENNEPQDGPVFVFAPIEPQDVRDTDVDAVRAWMKEAQISEADAFADAVASRRQEALDRIEEEQAAREEEDLRKVEDTTRQIEQEVADSNKKRQQQQQQQQNGQSGNQQDGSGYQDDSDISGSYDWDGYNPYGDDYQSQYGYNDAWGY